MPIPENNIVNHLHSSVCLLFILYKPPNLNWSINFSMGRPRGKTTVGTFNHFEKTEPFLSPWYSMSEPAQQSQVFLSRSSSLLLMAISSTYTSVPHSCSQPRSYYYKFFNFLTYLFPSSLCGSRLSSSFSVSLQRATPPLLGLQLLHSQ